MNIATLGGVDLKIILETNRKNKEVSESNEETKKNIEIQHTKDSYYRSKTKDLTLYEQMHRAYIPFTIEERLQESLHNFSTQKNKTLNNSVANYAPKKRTYSTSMSLTNRVMIVIGYCNFGFYHFWVSIHQDLRLLMNEDTKSFLQHKDKYKIYRQEHQRKVETKISEWIVTISR